MARPRKSTRDEWLDTFDDWDFDAQENALELAEWIHRRAKRKSAAKTEAKKEDADGQQQTLAVVD